MPATETISLAAAGSETILNLNDAGTTDNVAMVQVNGTFTTVVGTFQASADGTNYAAVPGIRCDTLAIETTPTFTNSTTRQWKVPLPVGTRKFRLNVSAIASGTLEGIIVTGYEPSIASQLASLSSAFAGAVTSTATGSTGGVGYATGAGAAVTQASSRTTGVTINAPCGSITLVSAAGSTTPATFTVTNNSVAATDNVVVSQKSGTDLYTLSVSAVAAGSFNITFNTKSGTTTEQPVFNFAVIKSVAA